MRSRFVGGLALACLTATSAHASTTTQSQLCWRSDGSSELGRYCAFNSTADGQPLNSSVDQSTPNADGASPNQVFSGRAYAQATLDSWRVALRLNVTDYRRDMYIWSEHQPPDDRTVVLTTGVASAISRDAVTINGGTGVYSLNYVFSLDGLLSSTDAALFSSDFCVGLMIPGGVGASASRCFNSREALPSTLTLTYSGLPFGEAVVPEVAVSALGLVSPILAAEVEGIGGETISGGLEVDFASTVHLADVLITDAFGVPVPGLTMTSLSGFEYPLDSRNRVGVIAEPSGAWLALIALLAFARSCVSRRPNRRH